MMKKKELEVIELSPREQEIHDLEQAILDGPFKETQELINSGNAWHFEGSIGRQCMEAINAGACMLGERGYHDYWGNYVPSRHEVKAGTKGSPEFVRDTETSYEEYGGYF